MKKKSIYVSEKLLNDLKIISKNSKIRISDLVEGLIVDGLSKLDSINIQIVKKGTSFSGKTDMVLSKTDLNKSNFNEDEEDEIFFPELKTDIDWTKDNATS